MGLPELIYFADCPNVPEARARLERALIEANLPVVWVEYRTDDQGLPDHARGFGSPTILVNGEDVAGLSSGGCSTACRIYFDEEGQRAGAPSLRDIMKALTPGAARGA